MCCIGTDFMSHAAATRDAAMVVHACGGVIPDGILSDADVDMADGFTHNPIFLVKQLRDKRAGLLDVKEVSLKVMLDAKFIKSGKSTLFIRHYASRYVADLCDDGTIVYAGETYAGPWKWVNFITNGSEVEVRHGKGCGTARRTDQRSSSCARRTLRVGPAMTSSLRRRDRSCTRTRGPRSAPTAASPSSA